MSEKERLADYLASLEPAADRLLVQIETKAREDRIPIIRKETGALLKTLIAALQPEQILEVGTAVGYSSLLMANVMPREGHITTIENYEKRIPIARENFRRAGMEERITLLEGDAGEIIQNLPKAAYRFIFMDAAKGQYPEFLVAADDILKPGGLLVADNVLLNGWVVDLQYPRHRQKTMVYRMKAFL